MISQTIPLCSFSYLANIPVKVKITIVLGLLLLTWHFAMIVYYVSPLPAARNEIVTRYCEPFFHQNWNLFVPVPQNNYKLFVKYKAGGETKSCEVFYELVSRHHQNRFSGYEAFVLAFSNTIFYFEQNFSKHETLNGPVTDNLHFTVLEHMCRQYLILREGQEIQLLQTIVAVKPLNGKMRVYYR